MDISGFPRIRVYAGMMGTGFINPLIQVLQRIVRLFFHLKIKMEGYGLPGLINQFGTLRMTQSITGSIIP